MTPICNFAQNTIWIHTKCSSDQRAGWSCEASRNWRHLYPWFVDRSRLEQKEEAADRRLFQASRQCLSSVGKYGDISLGWTGIFDTRFHPGFGTLGTSWGSERWSLSLSLATLRLRMNSDNGWGAVQKFQNLSAQLCGRDYSSYAHGRSVVSKTWAPDSGPTAASETCTVAGYPCSSW